MIKIDSKNGKFAICENKEEEVKAILQGYVPLNNAEVDILAGHKWLPDELLRATHAVKRKLGGEIIGIRRIN